jgi:hypothetical protein
MKKFATYDLPIGDTQLVFITNQGMNTLPFKIRLRT